MFSPTGRCPSNIPLGTPASIFSPAVSNFFRSTCFFTQRHAGPGRRTPRRGPLSWAWIFCFPGERPLESFIQSIEKFPPSGATSLAPLFSPFPSALLGALSGSLFLAPLGFHPPFAPEHRILSIGQVTFLKSFMVPKRSDPFWFPLAFRGVLLLSSFEIFSPRELGD